MNNKTFFLAVVLAALFVGAVPSFADGAKKNDVELSKSDEEFLASLPDNEFPGTAAGGLAASDLTGAEFMPVAEDTGTSDSGVKYVYKGYNETGLRRVIKDDRIDDGYVQGILLQRGPQ